MEVCEHICVRVSVFACDTDIVETGDPEFCSLYVKCSQVIAVITAISSMNIWLNLIDWMFIGL